MNRNLEVVSTLENALATNPGRAGLQLGTAYLQIGRDDKAISAFQRAIELDSNSDALQSDRLNTVAYELAEKSEGLPQALDFAKKAVLDEEEQSNEIDVKLSDSRAFAASNRLAAYWDTLAWVQFKLGNLDEAESYLKTAWIVTQSSEVGDHLGQVYEKLGKKQQAARAYRLALEAMGRNDDPQMRNRLKSSIVALSNEAKVTSAIKDSSVELSEERTVKLPGIRSWGGGNKSAEFVVAFTKESGVEETKFVSGAQELRNASPALTALKSSLPFPDESLGRIVRRGVLSCSVLAKGCVFVFYWASSLTPAVFSIPSVQQ
jgi:tetratricopeptide (TPR) repeat protein